MRQEYAVNLAERCDGDAVQDVVAVVEQNLGDADERGVEFIAPEHFSQFGGRGEDDLALDAARERHGVKKINRADAELLVFVRRHFNWRGSGRVLRRLTGKT